MLFALFFLAISSKDQFPTALYHNDKIFKESDNEELKCPENVGYTEITNENIGSISLNSAQISACKSTFDQQINAKNCIFSIFNCTFKVQGTSYAGGALYLEYSVKNKIDGGSIDHCYFIECTANRGGAAININGNEKCTEIKITNNYFIRNRSDKDGGAIYLESTAGTISNNHFIDNTAAAGCDIYYEIPTTFSLTYAQLTIENNVFNHAITNEKSLIYMKISKSGFSSDFDFNDNNVYLENAKEDTQLFSFSNPSNIRTNYFTVSGNAIMPYNDKITGLSEVNFEVNEEAFKPLVPPNPNCTIVDYTSGTATIDLCRRSGSLEKDVFITVSGSQFSDMSNTTDGGVLNNQECFFTCVRSSFTNCQSTNGGGGAIYVKNSIENGYDILIEKVDFKNCKAFYGGAVYVYSSNEMSTVLIKSCTFTSNFILQRTEDVSGGLTGGSSIFLNAIKGTIARCKFYQNTGNENVKIYNSFDGVAVRQLSDRKSFLSILNCTFERAKNSIFYMASESGSPVQIENCDFNGKMADGSYYINGKLLAKNAPKLRIKSCDFENKDRIVADNDLIDNQKFVYLNLKIGNALFAVIGIAVVIFALLVIKTNKMPKELNGIEDSNESI